MTEILPHIFVGNALDAQNQDRLREYGITHIINSTPDLPCFSEQQYQYLRIAILDLPSANIRKHFDSAIQFIDEALCRKGNNVLVHCSAGISRSPTLVLAYMIKKYRMTLDEAFSKMRSLRQIVDPNMSFVMQLREWEKRLMDTIDETNNSGSSSSRSATSATTYCGSSSKNKTDTSSLNDSAILVTH